MPLVGNCSAYPPCTRVPALCIGSIAELMLAINVREGLAPPAEVIMIVLCGWTKAHPYAF